MAMNDETISSREVMQIAANATGGEEKLAGLIGQDVTEVKAWLHGLCMPPFGTCIHVLIVLGCHLEVCPQEQGGVASIEAPVGSGGSLERFAALRTLKPSDRASGSLP
jgi:hypothetical protein